MDGNFGDHVAEYNREYGGLSEEAVDALRKHNERIANARDGKGFRTNEEIEQEKIKSQTASTPKIIEAKVNKIDTIRGGEVPIGGEFEITYTYAINDPSTVPDGKKPGEYLMSGHFL